MSCWCRWKTSVSIFMIFLLGFPYIIEHNQINFQVDIHNRFWSMTIDTNTILKAISQNYAISTFVLCWTLYWYWKKSSYAILMIFSGKFSYMVGHIQENFQVYWSNCFCFMTINAFQNFTWPFLKTMLFLDKKSIYFFEYRPILIKLIWKDSTIYLQ